MSNTQNEENKKDDGQNTGNNIEVKELENSEVEINAEIPAEEFEKFRKDAMKTLGEKANVDGFRKGHVPENIIESKFGEIAILEEMAQRAIGFKYPEILQDKDIDAIGQPEIQITKLAKGSPLGFKAKTAVLPVLTLPDYKKVAGESRSEEEKITITDKEVEDVITNIRKQRKQSEEAEKKTDSNDASEVKVPEENADTEKEGIEAKESKSEGKEAEKGADEAKEETLPELTDAVAKELGFDGLEDLKRLIRDNLTEEKQKQAKDKNRGAILDALVEKTTVSLPGLVVENELDRMMAQLKGEIAQMGLEFDKYLEHVGKTEEDLRKASKPDAENRAKSQLIINKIATLEEIRPKQEEIDKEVKALVDKYDDADAAKAQAYVEMVMTNELVLQVLEVGAKSEDDGKESNANKNASESDKKPDKSDNENS